MSERSSEEWTLFRSLVSQLERSPRVTGLAGSAESASSAEIASEAANSLIDIRQTATNLSSVLLPKLTLQQPESAEFDDTLDEIAEELRHIYYHIANTKLFDYVVPTG